MPVAIDTETAKILPGNLCPALACISWYNGKEGGLVHARDASEFMQRLLDSGEILIGHNIAYDVAVLCNHDSTLIPKFFKAYDEGRIRDTQIRQLLIHIAEGVSEKGYTLAKLAYDYKGTVLDKSADTYRLRYEELISVYPIDFWPKAARDYALLDAKITYEVWEAQGGDIVNESEQCRAALSLHLMSCWGMRCDPEAVAALKASLKKEYETLQMRLIQERIIRLDGTKNKKLIQARVAQARGVDYEAFLEKKYDPLRLPDNFLTEKGEIATTREILEESGDLGLEALAEFTAVEKLLMTFVPVLERGVDVPINARYKPIMETGRVSCEQPNLTNLPRKGGVRECFVPRRRM
jgi:hypothetical protein